MKTNVSKRQNIFALLICFAGVALNMLLNAVVTAFELPLYLDTVGTVIVAVMGGALPGALVGFITNIIKSFSDLSSLYYGVLNVLIAAVTFYMARAGWFKKIKGMIGAVFVYTLIGGGIGSLIPLFMEQLTFDSESLSGILLNTGVFSPTTSHILSSLILDLPDKALTVALAVTILHFIPQKIYENCGFSMWMQNPRPLEELETRDDNKKVRRLSLRIKMLLVLMISLITVAFVSINVSTTVYYNDIIREHEKLAQGTANLAAKMIDGDEVDDFIKTKGKSENYIKTRDVIKDILDSSPEISYLYCYKMVGEDYIVVLDVDTEDTPAETVGTRSPIEEGFLDQLSKMHAGEEIDPIITDDDYGHLLTAMKPVYDSSGKCVCYAIADVDVEMLIANRNSFLVEMISVFLSFFILLAAFVTWLADYQVIYPVKTITDAVDNLSFVSDSQDVLDEEVKAFRRIDVRTGDELEKLYESLCRMTLNQTEQLRSIRRLSDSTASMQDGLIITMADMVENRDSDTGAHIQKTAAYVKIIVDALQKKGYYSEKLTPKFISDVVRSAPLHDVGKINISDKVLNKPGPLTDEEREIMKTHTTDGKRIIEHAINTVKGDNYLKEARNMAAYHHERWDGKGYPEGLHGEVIPLSARIMAVADVFDALTSPRVYKPAYPVDKAIQMIQEGSGTQFDPKCVEAFLDSVEEVKIILKKYN